MTLGIKDITTKAIQKTLGIIRLGERDVVLGEERWTLGFVKRLLQRFLPLLHGHLDVL